MHIFDLYRRLLVLVITCYSAVRIIRSMILGLEALAGQGKTRRVVRGYIARLALTVRIRKFWPELTQIASLLAVLGLILYAHRFVVP